MKEKNICPVHGEKNANECHNYSAKKAEALGHPEWTVNPDCTCDVGITGPAGDKSLTEGTGPAKYGAERHGPAAENN